MAYPLFERVGRTQHLTAAGQQFRQKALAILNELGELKTSIRGNAVNTSHQIIRIAATSISNIPISVVIRHFLRDNKEMCFDINNTLQLKEAEQQLLAGQLDCAIYPTPPRSPHLSFCRIRQSPFVVVVAADSQDLSWDDYSYIVFRSRFEDYNELLWPSELHHLPIVAEADLKMAVLLCEFGKGALYVPQDYVSEHLWFQKLRILDDFPFQHYLNAYLIWNSELDPDSVVGHFIREAQAR